MACESVVQCDVDDDDDPKNVGSKKNDCLNWSQCGDDGDHDRCWCLCIGDDDDDDLDLVLGEIL